MKTLDGYEVATSDGHDVAGKNPDDYDYPLTASISEPAIYTAVTQKKSFTVVSDQ